MDQNEIICKIISDQFIAKRKLNVRFSLRAFSRQIGVSPASLSKMLNGKANLSLATIRKICLKLNLSSTEKDLLNLTEFDPYIRIDLSNRLAKPLLEDWTYFAILSLAETKSFQGNIKSIARRLSVSEKVAGKAVEDLIKLGLMGHEASGKLVSKRVNLTFSGQIENLKVHIQPRKSQIARLKLAQKGLLSLNKENFEESDFSSVTMAIDPKKIPEAKKRIIRFRRSLSKFLEAAVDKQEVYALAIQLFPLSS